MYSSSGSKGVEGIDDYNTHILALNAIKSLKCALHCKDEIKQILNLSDRALSKAALKSIESSDSVLIFRDEIIRIIRNDQNDIDIRCAALNAIKQSKQLDMKLIRELMPIHSDPQIGRDVIAWIDDLKVLSNTLPPSSSEASSFSAYWS